MSDVTIAAASAASGAVLSGVPPEDVLIYAVLGGLVAAWMQGDKQNGRAKSDILRWAVSVAGIVFVSAVSGVVISAILISVANRFDYLSPLLVIPRWAVAAVVSALIIKCAPYFWRVFTRRANREAENA